MGRHRMEAITSRDRIFPITQMLIRTKPRRPCKSPQRARKSQKPASQLHQAGAIRGCQRSAPNSPPAPILPRFQLRQGLPRQQRQVQARHSRIPTPLAQPSPRARKMQRNQSRSMHHRQALHLKLDIPRSCRALSEDCPQVVAQILLPKLLEVEGLSLGRL